MTSPCGPEPFIRRLSPFPPALLCSALLPVAARHHLCCLTPRILQGSCVTHHGQAAPSPTSSGAPTQGARPLLTHLQIHLGNATPGWAGTNTAFLPWPFPGTGMKEAKRMMTPDTSLKSRLVIKNVFPSCLGYSIDFPNRARGSCPRPLKVFSSSALRYCCTGRGNCLLVVGAFHSYCLLFSPRNPHKCDNCICSLVCLW